MSSSREQAMLQLRKWVDAKAQIRACLFASGICTISTGRLLFNADNSVLWLASVKGGEEVVTLALTLAFAVPCEHVEPLLDAPEEMRWKLDFVAAEAFRLPEAYLDLLEIGSPEISD